MGRNTPDAPEPPEGPRELPPGPPPGHAPPLDDSDDEADYYEGYEPLPLAPTEDGDLAMWSSDLMSSDSEDEQFENAELLGEEEAAAVLETPLNEHVPFIETVDREVTRELWATPREENNIDMNPEKAQEVMSAMANFSLPPSSFPEWAHNVSEEEWRQQLSKRINISQENR